MLPAEKAHYRKGLALGLTLAETFSIVVFILLLACAVLIQREQTQRDTAEAQRDTARIDLQITREMLLSESVAWGNADAWFEHSRQLRRELDSLHLRASGAERERGEAMAQAEAARALLDSAGVPSGTADSLLAQAARVSTLSDSLATAEESLRTASAQQDSMAARLVTLEELRDVVRTGITEDGRVTPEQADAVVERAAQAERVSDSLRAARNAIRGLDAQVRAAESIVSGDSLLDSLRKEVRELQMSEDTLIYKLGIGIEPPPCWMDANENPEHIFRIELTDGGLRMSHIAPPYYAVNDPNAMRYAAQIEEGRVYSPAEFGRLTRPFLDLGLSQTREFGPKGCRYWVHAIDSTGDRKDIFKARLTQLERHFYKRWVSPPQ